VLPIDDAMVRSAFATLLGLAGAVMMSTRLQSVCRPDARRRPGLRRSDKVVEASVVERLPSLWIAILARV
jgi:hypothetical protein